VYQINIKFDRQLRPATVTMWVVSYGGKTFPRWRTAAILKIDISPYLSEQELSYRKQITRQLRTQYLELLDVEYYRDLKMWVRGHSRSLKLVPFESLGAVSYSPSIVTMAVSVAVCEIFSVKDWRDLEN